MRVPVCVLSRRSPQALPDVTSWRRYYGQGVIGQAVLLRCDLKRAHYQLLAAVLSFAEALQSSSSRYLRTASTTIPASITASDMESLEGSLRAEAKGVQRLAPITKMPAFIG